MTESGEMRAYWDERARLNAAWYVDTSLSFDAPDMQAFFESGRKTVTSALEGMPVQPPSNDLAVEIGPGIGRMCLALADRFDRVVGVDISPEMVERARELVPSEKITFVAGDGASLAPVADGTVDVVFSFTVFQHIPRVSVIERYISEAARVLKPQGVFVFQWNNTPGALRWAVRRSITSKLRRFSRFRERHDRNHPAFLGSRVPLGRIKRALEKSGLELERTEGLDTLFAWAWATRSPTR
jgi:SAM-dependent methyltransferase